MRWICGAWIALTLGLATAWADGRPDLKVEIEVAREVSKLDANGETKVELEPAAAVRAGEVLVYTLRYRNDGDGTATGATLDDPVPQGTVLIRESVVGEGAHITFSMDGQAFSEWPKVKSTTLDGKVQWVDAPASAVKHVRWRLAQAVPPGGEGRASFKVVVE